MPLESIFQKTAAELDEALVEGMNVAIDAGLSWAAPQLQVGLSLYVIGHAIFMMYGKMDGATFVTAIVRALAVAAILKVAAYDYYVRDLFFTDIPNATARAMGGPRVTISSADQFDAMWGAVLHYSSFINGQASSWTWVVHRGVVWLLAFMNLGALWVMFAIWYIARGFMALIICIGPFLIILYLFRGTRGFVDQWIGKLVALTILQLAASILLRILLVILAARLRAMDQNPGISVDEMIANAAGVTGVFWLGALMMFVLPSALAIGSGSIGAAVTAGAGMLAGAGSMVGGVAGGAAKGTVGGAARLGKALGRYTGSR